MVPRSLLWIGVPLALSAGIIWLSAQDGGGLKGSPDGIKLEEMAGKLQARERDVALREAAIGQVEQRLNTLRVTIDQERGQLAAREKAIEEEKENLFKVKSKLNEDRATFEREKAKELDRLREIEKNIELERKKEIVVTKVEEQLIRTFEAMDPIAASKALKELAGTNQDIAVGLLVAMQPKKVAKLFDQMANEDAKLTAALSEQVGKRKKEQAAAVRR
jgi:flagellar motility protein MotE (MotC chaperone)